MANAMTTDRLPDVVALQQRLAHHGFIAERSFAAALLLTLEMRRPLLIEGEAGVGKTEVAKALARLLDTRLIRLQCYEGLDAHTAMYEWNYPHQLLAIKLFEQDERPLRDKEADIFSERYLLKRPLLDAITATPAPVLLIDEIDRTDEAFEAYLLELLSDFQLSIPELGVIRAAEIPYVILTSNGTREISDALRRRCLYQYVDYPDFERELRIVRTRAPDVPERLARQIVEFVQSVRQMELRRKPGLAETLDWVAALLRLGVSALDENGVDRVMDSLAALVKTREDQAGLTRPVVEKLVASC
jgi:MoxR-like ATPase